MRRNTRDSLDNAHEQALTEKEKKSYKRFFQLFFRTIVQKHFSDKQGSDIQLRISTWPATVTSCLKLIPHSLAEVHSLKPFWLNFPPHLCRLRRNLKFEVSNCSGVSQENISSQLALAWSVQQSEIYSPLLVWNKCGMMQELCLRSQTCSFHLSNTRSP